MIGTGIPLLLVFPGSRGQSASDGFGPVASNLLSVTYLPIMEHVLIFANPIAGRGKGKLFADVLRQELTARGYRVTTFFDRVDSITQDLPAGPVRAAIVIGGDGTLRSVAQWAIERARAVSPQAADDPTKPCLPYPLLIVPMGTANLMGRHLGIAWNEKSLGEQVAGALEQRRIVHLDVAKVGGGGIFLVVAGVGFDAWVIHEMDRLRSGPIHIATYALPVLKGFAEYKFHSLQVTVDGRCVFEKAPALALIGNVPEYGTGFPVLPLARSDDQLLDVCIMPCASRSDLVRLFLAATTGDHIREEGVVYVKGRHIHIESPETVAVQIDGEPAGFTPVDIDLLPGRIPFIVPPQ